MYLNKTVRDFLRHHQRIVPVANDGTPLGVVVYRPRMAIRRETYPARPARYGNRLLTVGLAIGIALAFAGLWL